MVSLYPSVDVYTAQLLALQNDSAAHPDSAPDHFVLAYHYLTQGYPKNAEYELKQVIALQPKDTLSARLLDQLKHMQATPVGGGAAPAPAGGAAPGRTRTLRPMAARLLPRMPRPPLTPHRLRRPFRSPA